MARRHLGRSLFPLETSVGSKPIENTIIYTYCHRLQLIVIWFEQLRKHSFFRFFGPFCSTHFLRHRWTGSRPTDRSLLQAGDGGGRRDGKVPREVVGKKGPYVYIHLVTGVSIWYLFCLFFFGAFSDVREGATRKRF